MTVGKRLWLVSALMLLLTSAACGDDGGSGSNAPSDQPASDDLLGAIQDRGYMNAGIATYAPYAMLDADGAPTGIFVDMTDEIAKRLGVNEVNYVVMSSAAFVPALDSGRVDTLPGYSKTDERAEVADFSDPVMYLPDCMMVAKGSGITSLEQLEGKTLGLTRGSYAETVAEGLVDGGVFTPGDIVKYDSFEAPLREIADGRVDAGYFDVVGFEWGKKENPELFGRIECIPVPPELQNLDTLPPVFYLFPKGNSSALLEQVNGIVSEMAADGTTEEIFGRYGLSEPSLITGEIT
jgi:ABC-type amino acid transport substrate-binding protein